MRWLTALLLILLGAIQYPLFFGKGSWNTVQEYQEQLDKQRHKTHEKEIRNAGLDAEVRDLKQGLDAVEERARNELNMIRRHETYLHFPDEKTNNKTNNNDETKTNNPNNK